jgi:hypothetical protein
VTDALLLLVHDPGMAAPPRARDGKPAASAGRPIVAGVSSFLRLLSARATDAGLWVALEVLAVEDEGLDRLETLHGVWIDSRARRRYSAFIAQARQYFNGTKSIEPIANSLLGYYFALNLTKVVAAGASGPRSSMERAAVF